MLHIIAHHRIPPVLLDFIHCFGAKVTGEDNPFYGTFHSSISLEKGNGSKPRGWQYGMSNLPSLLRDEHSSG
jgi:hypothetical protein